MALAEVTVSVKLCTKCGVTKFAGNFNKCKSNLDGLDGHCRACRRAYKEANKQKFAERSRTQAKQWYYDNREKALETRKAYARNNPELVSKIKKKHYEANREVVIERSAQWAIDNPDSNKAINRRKWSKRRARLLNAFVEHVEPRVVFERDEGVCGICEEPVTMTDYHIDHIVPLAKGGEHSYANVQLAHPVCNLRKGTDTHFSFAKENIF